MKTVKRIYVREGIELVANAVMHDKCARAHTRARERASARTRTHERISHTCKHIKPSNAWMSVQMRGEGREGGREGGRERGTAPPTARHRRHDLSVCSRLPASQFPAPSRPHRAVTQIGVRRPAGWRAHHHRHRRRLHVEHRVRCRISRARPGRPGPTRAGLGRAGTPNS